VVDSNANGGGKPARDTGFLQLLKREATASPNAAVILDSGTSHNWAQLVNWTGSNSSGFLETGLTTAELAAGLVEVNADATLPVLVEV